MTIHDKGWARFFRFTDSGGTWGEIIGIDGKETWRLSVLRALPGFEPADYMRRLAGHDFAPRHQPRMGSSPQRSNAAGPRDH
jgi:hypothetical protein